VPFTATSASDALGRIVGQRLSEVWGQQIVIDNRPGAGGLIGSDLTRQAAPDGYTLAMIGQPHLSNALLREKKPYDPVKDFTSVVFVGSNPNVIVIGKGIEARTIPELIALAKAKPKTLVYMAPSLSKVAFMEHFNQTNGTDFVRVPFKGGGDAVNSMLSATTPVAIFGLGNIIQYIRDGRIHGLAVDGDQRSPLAPDIPTFKELGYTVHTFQASFGIHAPAGTPKDIVNKMNAAIVKIGSNPEFQKRHMIVRGLTPVFDSPEQFDKQLDADRVAGKEIVKGSGLYPDLQIN
jgi:tripartite-type tricarboxylate transporter receptor subunit TctC